MSGTQSDVKIENAVDNSTVVNAIYEFLKKGDEETKFRPNTDIILLLGNTGSGKTTLSQFIAGNSDHLISQEVEEGTGEFIIVDKNNKISNNSTVVSQTIFPDLVEDVKTNTTYYDCPGFSDTRSAAHEIAASYFIKKVIDSSRSVKLVFVVNHHSVRKGVDRKDFILMLKHSVDFINNIDKFINSIALIVTKVETRASVADKTVIRMVANYLKQVKMDITNQPGLVTSSGTSSGAQRRLLLFLDTLLYKEQDDYLRIGVFRRPDESGKLTDIESLKSEKVYLQNMIDKNINFVKIDQEDFGYTLSSDSKIHTNGLVKKIYQRIANKLSFLNDEIINYYNIQETGTNEIEKLDAKFSILYDTFSKIQKNAIHNALTPKELIHEISQNINVFNISISLNCIKSIEKEEGYIQFLDLVSNQSAEKRGSAELANGLSTLVSYFRNSQRFYSFSTDLYKRLSQYDIQKNRDIYRNINQPIIKLSDIDSPIRQAVADTFDQYEDIRDIPLNKPELNFLNKIFENTLNYRADKNCDINHKLIIKGEFIMLSDVSKEKCNGRNMKSIELLALNKVFFDTDLDLTGDEVQLAIIAPTWEVLGKSRIILDGKSGEEYAHSKAASGKDLGSNGSDGQPGRPGGPAGSFFGIGKHFINDDLLQISANGGNGGKGQDGGDGTDGADGPSCRTCKKAKSVLITIIYNEGDEVYPGQPGGSGGNGGIGGVGGYAGSIIIKQVGANKKPMQTVISTAAGATGNPGSGGKAGRGGRYFGKEIVNVLGFVHVENLVKKNEWAESGIFGVAGGNGYGRQNTWNTRALSVDSTRRNYAEFLKSNLRNHCKESFLKSFIMELDNDQGMPAFQKHRKRRYLSNGDLLKYKNYPITIGMLKIISNEYEGGTKELVKKNSHLSKTATQGTENLNEERKVQNLKNSHKHFVNADLFGKVSTEGTNATTANDNSFIKNILNNTQRGFVPSRELNDYKNNKSSISFLSVARDTNVQPLALHSDNASSDEIFLKNYAPLRNCNSNLLLCDLILKKIMGKRPSPAHNKLKNNEEMAEFATDLAYNYYATNKRQ